MKKLIAFLTALAVFAVSACGLHFYAKNRVAVNSNSFSFWAADGKFGARSAILENINKDTVAVFGSSEFQHGRKTPYHPGNMFQDTSFNMMLIGAGYYQSLSHAVTLASIGDSLKTRQAVLFVSPQWFRKPGVQPEAFASRFSETHYAAMLQNEKLRAETKTYIMNRTSALLEADPPALKRVSMYNRVLCGKPLAGEPASLLDKINYSVYSRFLKEKELQTVSALLDRDGIRKDKSAVPAGSASKDGPDFAAFLKQAEADGKKQNTGNAFYMDDTVYKKKIVPSMKKKHNQSLKGSYITSPEFDDLRCFLNVCKDLGIQPLLVMLPVNGYWYDYTGFPKTERDKYYEKIRDIAAAYHAGLADFGSEEYTEYFFEDGIHIGKKGWVMVNESIYRFYKDNLSKETV